MGMARKPNTQSATQNGDSDQPVTAFTIRLSPEMMLAFDAFRSSQMFKPSRQQVAEKIFGDFLVNAGFWPPKPK